jgi:hypothetical protein
MNWLQPYLSESVRRNLCTKVVCTTCGAREFRTGLLAATAGEIKRDPLIRLDLESAIAIGRALGRVEFDDSDPPYIYFWFESAVRLVLTDIWVALGDAKAEQAIEPLLTGSWAGDLLLRMKQHHAALLEADRKRQEEQDPVHIGARRTEKRRLKQQRHADRLARKRDRDRVRRDHSAGEE